MLVTVSEGRYKLRGELDIEHAESLAQLLALSDTPCNHLEIDCSELQSADSLLLASILSLARKMEQKQGTLSIMNFPEKLAGLAKTYSVESLIHRYCSK